MYGSQVELARQTVFLLINKLRLVLKLDEASAHSV